MPEIERNGKCPASEDVEQLQPLFEPQPQIVRHNNNGMSTRTSTDYVDSRISLSSNDIVISVRNAHKNYGKVKVLLGLDMSIPRGAIYGLLGPSGCGKTTLLQCIVGKQRIQSGEVLVFGGKPGSRKSGVPGHRVGFMPQELAIYNEFTVRETLSYFGRIFKMSSARIKERTEFLISFLDLPPENRLVGKLSGGQQRRASLAAALLHEPELLILDEPTVGVDPLLRQCIWDHLLLISKTRTTIVITTHYIEEARQANVVGMMRFGKLLSEDSPTKLLQTFEMPSLEDVFLHLCHRDELERGGEDLKVNEPQSAEEKMFHLEEIKVRDTTSTSLKNGNAHNNKTPEVEIREESGKNESCDSSGFCDNFFRCHRFVALLIKNFIRIWRNIGFLLFQFLIPIIQVSVFCLAIGHDPGSLQMAVVNREMISNNFSVEFDDPCTHFTSGCILGNKDEFMNSYDFDDYHKANLSCRFMSHLADVEPRYFGDLDSALESVRRGENWGVLDFSPNYSNALFERLFGIFELKAPDQEAFNSSTVRAYLDMTNQHVGHIIKLRLSESYIAFSKDLLSSCKFPPDMASLPVMFEEPVYGTNHASFTEFMAPGVILSITYFMAVGLTALSFIIEKKEGLLDRSWMAGVTATEVMLAHVVAQFVVLLVQVALVLVFMIYVFDVPARGPIFWIIVLTLIQGICGMSFGLVISALCDNEQDAIQVGLGSFYPNFLLSGIIWPIEGMPLVLQYLACLLPQTYACEAMRSLLSRGWGIAWVHVYRGYLVTIAWTVIQLALSAIILRLKR